MTLVEALVAIAIVCGVMGTAIETFQFGLKQSIAYELDIEAVSLAESLLARIGEDLPLQMQKTESLGEGTLVWSIGSQNVGASAKMQLLQIESHVKITRSGLVSELTLSSLKLLQVKQK